MTTDANDAIVFRSEGLDAGVLRVRKLRGREAISRLFRFDIHLETSSGELLEPEQFDGLLNATASVSFGYTEEHPVHGMVREVDLCEGSLPGRTLYRVTMVPRIWHATRWFRSRVFQELSVPEIVEAMFSEGGLEPGLDFELRLTAPHPKREYTVQYQETDFAFLSRMLEYEGMFFFFEQGEQGEKLVIGDSNFAFHELPSFERIPFVPGADALTAAAQTVTALGLRRRIVEQRVHVADYNYRIPAVPLAGEAEVDAEGAGERTHYGEHFKTPDDGKRLAAIRAEERGAQKLRYTGQSNVRGLRAGHRFALEGHPFAPMDQEYVVVERTHAADQGWDAEGALRPYRGKLTAIPRAVAFRPRRTTAWPRIAGVLHARIDGAQSTTIDEHGRYKVLLPFDSATPGAGRASRWIRMAQPAGGPNAKMHFPLEVGTEVLLGHIDGDPDRPIILSAAPNHATPSPVIARNAMQNVIRSRAGIQIVLDDEPGPQ